MSVEQKNKFADIVAVFTVCFAIFVGILTASASNYILPIILGAGALIYGPLCFILYLIEVKRGVFDVDDEEEVEE